MSHVIMSEVFITVAAIIVISVFTASFLGNMQQLRDIQILVTQSLEEKMSVDIKIVFAYANKGETTVKVWIKNVGVKGISYSLIGKGDLFFGPDGNFSYIPYNSDTLPTWNFTVLNDVDGDGRWDRGETIQITIYLDTTLDNGDYYVRYVTYTGCYDEYQFSI